MLSYKQKLILILILASNITFSGLGRPEFEWRDYQDFGLNNGKFEIGKKNIIVYKKDGTKSVIDKPMPNFDGASNPHNIGGSNMWDDPQIVSSVTHVIAAGNNPTKAHLSYLNRHLRKDVNLYNNYKNNISNNNKRGDEVKRLSDSSPTQHVVAVGEDYAFLRLNHILHDSITYETYEDEDELNELVKPGALIARAGSGINAQIINDRITTVEKGYNFAGGLNKIIPNINNRRNETDAIKGQKAYRHANITIKKDEEKTPFDIATMAGDSGSLVLAWSERKQKWIAVLNNSAGKVTNTWDKWSILLTSPHYLKEFKEKVTDTAITSANDVKFENGKLFVDGVARTFDTYRISKGQKLIDILPANGSRAIDPEFFLIKNQVFDTDNLTINVNGDTDTSVARMDFKKNTTITGTGNLKTAGFVVHNGATLTYEAPINAGNTIRKIGEGTLEIKGSVQNEGDINVGGGGVFEIEKSMLLLNNSGGYAAKNIRLAQGATVKLMKENQLNGNNIYFGLRGGFLDLNGQNLEFNDIYHVDKGAKIINTNENQKSTFTFNSNSDDVTFLGGFEKNIDVNYTPTNDNAKWKLRGNHDFKDLNINKGTISIGGDVVTYVVGPDKIVEKDKFTRSKFKSDNINVTSTLEVNRAAEIDSNIKIKENAKLNVIALGNVVNERDERPDYEGAPKEMEVNKIVFNNNINFEGNSSENFIVNTENNNEVDINSKISGNLNAEKLGAGILRILSNENNTDGNFKISGGIVELSKEDTLKNTMIDIKNNSVLRVSEVNDMNTILSKLDKSSLGVLSLGNSVNRLPQLYSEFPTLFLGSNKNITLGSDGVAIDNAITTLNLGGDNGTVTLKGIAENSNVRTINVGDGINKGKVIIDGVKEDANFELNIKKGVELEVQNNRSNNKFVELGYGAHTDYTNKSLVKNESEGVLLLKNTDTNPTVDSTNTYLGANEGEIVELASVQTGDEAYRLSGSGVTNVNFNLDNSKKLIVDAQYLDGGVVEIKTENAMYSNEISILGNREQDDNTKGSISLKMSSDVSLGIGNTFKIRNGGALDLAGNNISMKIHDENNLTGSIVNTNSEISNIHLDQDKNLILNNKIGDNIKIVKANPFDLELKNSKNTFNELDVTAGKLIHNTDGASAIKTILRDNTKMEVSTNIGVEKEVVLDGGALRINNKNNDILRAGTLTLLKDGVVTGHGKNASGKRTVFEKINLDNKKLTFNNIPVKIIDIDRKQDNISEIEFNNSIFVLRASSTKLTKDKVSKISMNNTTILLKSFTNNEKIETHTNSDLLTPIKFAGNNNEILTGDQYGNNVRQDGQASSFYNPIELAENSNLTFLNSNGYAPTITIGSKIIGSGNIKVKGEFHPNQKFKFTHNSPNFTGTMRGEGAAEHIFAINKDNEEDRTIGFSILSGRFSNQSNKDLAFKNLSQFNGTITGQNGGIILIGENAINTSGNIRLNNNKNLTLKANDENVEVSKPLNVTMGENSRLIKDGNAKIHFTEDVNVANVKNIDINEGELSLVKDISTKTDDANYSVASGATLTLKENTDVWDTNIQGEGNFKQGGEKASINISKLNNTGDIQLTKELELIQDKAEDITIKGNLKGENDTKLTLKKKDNIDTDETSIDIDKNLSNFKGTFNLESANLGLNIENLDLTNKITGTKNLINKNNTDLTLNDLETFIGKAIARNGNIVLKNEKAINTEATLVLENDKDLILETTSLTTVDKALKISKANNSDNSKLVKRGNEKLVMTDNVPETNLKNALIEEGELEISKNILELENSKYDIKENAELILNYIKDGEIDASVLGNGTLVQDGKYIVLNNVEEFNGDIVANKALELNIDKDINAEKITLNDGFVKFTNNSNKTISFENTTFENNGDNFFKKAGNSDVKISSEQLSGMKNLKIEEGTLELFKEKYNNKINANIEIFENSKLNITNDMFINKIKNSGVVSINDTNLKIENYEGKENSRFDITLSRFDKLLTLENSMGIFDANLFLDKEVLSEIKNNRKELTVSNAKPELNILNLETYDAIYSLKKRQDGLNTIIYSYVAPKSSNLLYALSSLNNLNDVSNFAKFETNINVNDVNARLSDNISKFANEGTYRNFLQTKGFEINGEYAKKIDKYNLSFRLTLRNTDNHISSKVSFEDENKTFTRNFKAVTLLPKMALKYKEFGGELELGFNKVKILENNAGNITYLKSRATVFYNPEFQLDDTSKLVFSNYLSYVHNPIVKESITKNDKDISKISLSRPNSISIETGIKYTNPYVDFNVILNPIYDFSRLNISNSEEKLENIYGSSKKVNLKYGLNFKITKSLSLQFEGSNSIGKSKEKVRMYKLGFEYKW